jgi:hypothetical protein
LSYNDFKNDFCKYYNSSESTRNKVNKLKLALDHAAINILPLRDTELCFQVRDFTNTSSLDINFINENIMCYYSISEDKMITGVISPNWRTGWGNISKDKFVCEQISLLFHFISQYIIRSYQVNLIGAIALATGRPSDFRGTMLSSIYSERTSQEIDSFKSRITDNTSILSMKTIGYLKLINSLDPFVNKVIFYFIRFLQLDSSMFTEESMTAADNMVDTIFQSIKIRKKLPTKERKEMCNYVYKEIGLYDQTDIFNLDRLYLLRCGFTAHPAKSKWWDFYEIYDNDIEKIKLSIRKILILYLKYENVNRQIEAHPISWSIWFKEYCDIVYNAVWFHNVP